jgi:hypothetical protein
MWQYNEGAESQPGKPAESLQAKDKIIFNVSAFFRRQIKGGEPLCIIKLTNE